MKNGKLVTIIGMLILLTSCSSVEPVEDVEDIGDADVLATVENEIADEDTDTALSEQESKTVSCADGFLLEEREYPEMYENAKGMVKELFELDMELLCEWPSYVNQKESIEITDEKGMEHILYRVTTTDTWATYEERALEIYSEDYVTNVFTPYYLNGIIFAEQDGKLYRAESDGWTASIREDSVQVWQQTEEGSYIVSGFRETDAGEQLVLLTVKRAEDKKFGFEITGSKRCE